MADQIYASKLYLHNLRKSKWGSRLSNLDYILENYVYALKDARKGDHMSHAGISIWHCKGLWAIK